MRRDSNRAYIAELLSCARKLAASENDRFLVYMIDLSLTTVAERLDSEQRKSLYTKAGIERPTNELAH